MNPIDGTMKGGNTIINNGDECLLTPSIKCDNSIDYSLYSSMIITNDYHLKSYGKDLSIDRNKKYLIDLPNKCNISKSEMKECSNLQIDENDDIINLITEQSYSLDDYINNPKLLGKFISDNPNFMYIFLDEFKKLFEGIKYLSEKKIAHQKINPKNIIFNTKTKKMKFINFGKRKKIEDLINEFNINRYLTYTLNIYYPFVCFFMNYDNYSKYKDLTNGEKQEFVHFLNNLFFGNVYVSSNNSNKLDKFNMLKSKFEYIKKSSDFKEYKDYIKSTYGDDKIFFYNVLSAFRSNYIGKDIRTYNSFIKYSINMVDIYGLSLSLLHFITMLKNNYSVDDTFYNLLSGCLKYLSKNEVQKRNSTRNVQEKAYIYFKTNYNLIIKKKNKSGVVQPLPVEDLYGFQYKLKSDDIHIIDKNINKSYIIYNGKLMRTFTKENIFIQLDKLSEYNKNKIKQKINNTLKNSIILIDKEAYHKIKYNLICNNEHEVNPYTKKCTRKCPPNYKRDFEDSKFGCTRKNINKKNEEKNKKSTRSRKQEKQQIKCPSGYEKNPFTKKCTRKCNKGYIRNLKFNCVAEKDVL